MSNGTTNYKLGELTQGFNDVCGRLDKYEIKNSREHKNIKDELKTLNVWRWKVVGAMGAMAVVGQIVIELLKDFIK